MIAFRRNVDDVPTPTLTRIARARRAAAVAGLLAAVASVGMPSRAHAGLPVPNPCSGLQEVTTAFLAVVINGQCSDLSDFIRGGEKEGTASLSRLFELDGGTVSVNAFWDADPFITFGLSTMNATAGPTTYSFIFGTPIVPGSYQYAEGTLDGSLTPAQTSASLANSVGSPTFLSGFGSVGPALTNLGVDVGSGPCTATTSAVACGNGMATNAFALSTFYNNLEAQITYTQSGIGSTASFTGRIEIFADAPSSTVPEPSTYALMALGLGVLGVIARRRKQHAG